MTLALAFIVQGCRVIGSCGTEEKIKFVKSIGFDDAFNYKTESVDDALKRLAPKGVDCYFDNVRKYLIICGSVPRIAVPDFRSTANI